MTITNEQIPPRRKNFAKKVQAAVAARCRRRCALCYFLDDDVGPKHGQFAHIDRNHGNNSADNAAYLCPNHHDEYDTTPSQTAKFTPNELKLYQQSLFVYVDAMPTESKFTTRSRHARVSLELYDRRLPTYHTAMQFVREVAADLKPEMQMMMKFSGDTREALFLFDKNIDEYLGELFRKALRLHTLQLLRERAQRAPMALRALASTLLESAGALTHGEVFPVVYAVALSLRLKAAIRARRQFQRKRFPHQLVAIVGPVTD
jgi:hypothetical protein